MATIKISSKVEEQAWDDLKQAAQESRQSISVVLTDAISEYLQRRRVRTEVLDHIENSMRDNAELGKLLAK